MLVGALQLCLSAFTDSSSVQGFRLSGVSGSGDWWAAFPSQSIHVSLWGIDVQKPTCDRLRHYPEFMEVATLAHEILSIRKLTSTCSNFPFLKMRWLYFHMNLVLVETALNIPFLIYLQKWHRTNGSTVTVLHRVHQNLSTLARTRG